MIEFTEGPVRFNYRVAGVCIREGRVLLHGWAPYDLWALPGGRPELLEFSTDALAREMREETDLRVDVVRLLWIAENFFAHDGHAFMSWGSTT